MKKISILTVLLIVISAANAQQSKKEIRDAEKKLKYENIIKKHEGRIAELEAIQAERELTQTEAIKLNNARQSAGVYRSLYETRWGEKNNDHTLFLVNGQKLSINSNIYMSSYKLTVKKYDEEEKQEVEKYKNSEVYAIVYPDDTVYYASADDKFDLPIKEESTETVSPKGEKQIKRDPKLHLTIDEEGLYVIMYDANYVLLKYIDEVTVRDANSGVPRAWKEITYTVYDRSRGIRITGGQLPLVLEKKLKTDEKVNEVMLPIVKKYFGNYSVLFDQIDLNLQKEISFDFGFNNLNIDGSEDLFKELSKGLQ